MGYYWLLVEHANFLYKPSLFVELFSIVSTNNSRDDLTNYGLLNL